MSKEWETVNVGGRKRLRRRPVRYQHGGTTAASTATTTTSSAPAIVVDTSSDDDGDEAGAYESAGLYDDMTKAELIEEAESRGLDTSGNKPDIRARIEADDAA